MPQNDLVVEVQFNGGSHFIKANSVFAGNHFIKNNRLSKNHVIKNNYAKFRHGGVLKVGTQYYLGEQHVIRKNDLIVQPHVIKANKFFGTHIIKAIYLKRIHVVNKTGTPKGIYFGTPHVIRKNDAILEPHKIKKNYAVGVHYIKGNFINYSQGISSSVITGIQDELYNFILSEHYEILAEE